MTLRHADDHVGLGGQFGGQHLAALGGDIDPQILHGPHGVFRWRLAVLCAYTSRFHGEIGVIFLDQITKQALSHRAAADVSGADEQDGMAHTRGGIDCGFSRQPSTAEALGLQKNVPSHLVR